MPKRPCSLCSYPGCRAITLPGEGRCSKHPYTFSRRSGWQADSVRGNAKERGYGSAWVHKRNVVMIRDHGLCQVCARAGLVRVATEVDHILPKSAGGTDDLENLQAICHYCHVQKTSQEAANALIAKVKALT